MRLLDRILGRAEAAALAMEAPTKTVEEPVAPTAPAAEISRPPALPRRQVPAVRSPIESVEIRQALRQHRDLVWTTERLGERLVVELDAIQTLLSAILEEVRTRPA